MVGGKVDVVKLVDGVNRTTQINLDGYKVHTANQRIDEMQSCMGTVVVTLSLCSCDSDFITHCEIIVVANAPPKYSVDSL